MISNHGKSINSLINFNECDGLNVSGSENLKDVFGFGGGISSNLKDPEVIISIKFKCNVNISGILIEGSMDKSTNPTTMKLFINKTSLDFSDISTVTSTETVDLSKNLGKLISLKIAKFKSVSTISVFNLI